MRAMQPGFKVRIVEDIRDRSNGEYLATGQSAEYEGEFPLAVLIQKLGKVQEVDYDKFMEGGWDKKMLHFIQARELHPEWFGAMDAPHWISDEAIYWVELTNPRFILADGSKIWGAECWWEPWEEEKPLEVSEKELEHTKDVLRTFFQILGG